MKLLKVFHGGNVYTDPQGTCYRMLCYLDSQKDYLCTRFEMHLVKDEFWQQFHDTELKTAPDIIEKQLKATRIRQATEFARITDGKWYPKTIVERFEKELPEGGVSRSHRTYNIYLDDNPQFADGIFDPESLPTQPD